MEFLVSVFQHFIITVEFIGDLEIFGGFIECLMEQRKLRLHNQDNEILELN